MSADAPTPGSQRSAKIAGVTTAVVVLAAVAGLALWEAYYLNLLWIGLRAAALPLLLLLGVVVAIVAGVSKIATAENEPSHVEPSKAKKPDDASADGAEPVTVVRWRAWSRLAATAGLLAVVAAVLAHGYLHNRAIYQASVAVVTDQEAPTFAERAALEPARAQAASAVTSNGELVTTAYGAEDSEGERQVGADVTYLPDQGVYTALVTRRGWLAGYSEVVSMELGLTGQTATSTSCLFDADANDRLGGWWHTSLSREIVQAAGLGTVFNRGDAYAFCDGERPVVVVPLKTQSGLYPVTQKPAGVAVYDGLTGEVEVLREVGGTPGPVYPISLSERQLEATRASGGFWDHVFGRVGFLDTSGDPGDPNAGNNADFTLALADGSGSAYATPVVVRGGSTAISGLGVVAADVVTPGTLNTYTVHRFAAGEQRPANSAVVDDIKARYGDLPWATGLRVFEIAPVSPQTWVASIGLDRNVTHRVHLDADGASCLLTGASQTPDCGAPAPRDGEGEGESPPAGVGIDLGSLSDEELAEMLRDVAEEAQRRLGQGD